MVISKKTLKIPQGWIKVETGLSRKGDKAFSGKTGKFEEIKQDKAGILVELFICVIRKSDD